MHPEDEEVAPGWLPPRPPPDRAGPAAEPVSTPATPAARREPGALPAPPRPKSGGPTDPLAPVSLGMGVVAVLLLVLSAGAAFLIALPLAFGGWRVAVLSRRRIAAGRATAGDGIAQAAIFLALAAIGIAVVAMVAWTILSMNGYTPEDLQRSLERRTR